MKRHSTTYRLLILIASVAFTLAAAYFIYSTKNIIFSTEGDFTPTLISTFVYLILVNIVSGSKARVFNAGFDTLQNLKRNTIKV